MTIPQTAIEAAAEAVSTLDWTQVEHGIAPSDSEIATATLEAAIPHIREQIAKEIERKTPLAYYPHESGYGESRGMEQAAKIARGKA